MPLKCVPKGQINNILALVEIMAWRRPGNKPLSNPMVPSVLTHICVTRPQWVNVYLEVYAVILMRIFHWVANNMLLDKSNIVHFVCMCAVSIWQSVNVNKTRYNDGTLEQSKYSHVIVNNDLPLKSDVIIAVWYLTLLQYYLIASDFWFKPVILTHLSTATFYQYHTVTCNLIDWLKVRVSCQCGPRLLPNLIDYSSH